MYSTCAQLELGVHRVLKAGHPRQCCLLQCVDFPNTFCDMTFMSLVVMSSRILEGALSKPGRAGIRSALKRTSGTACRLHVYMMMYDQHGKEMCWWSRYVIRLIIWVMLWHMSHNHQAKRERAVRARAVLYVDYGMRERSMPRHSAATPDNAPAAEYRKRRYCMPRALYVTRVCAQIVCTRGGGREKPAPVQQ